MKTTFDEQELTRWLDGEMSATEVSRFESRLQADPVMHSEAQAMKQLCFQVKTHFPRIADVPHADFFNSQIQELISGQDQPRQEHASPWLRWLTRPWVILAGATALLLLAGLTVFQADPDSDTSTTLLNTYAPDATIQPRTFHSNDANATVLELDGVEEIPADSNVVSYKMLRKNVGPRVAQTAPYSDHGHALPAFAMTESSPPLMIVP